MIDGTTFAWDENKSQANLAKHGVTFDAAEEIFSRPVLEFIDDRRDRGETRIAAIGVAHGVELTVIFTRRGATHRIISARRARRDERRAYYQTYPRELRDDRTDWARVDAMTEGEIDAAAHSDPDNPPLDVESFKHAKVITPPPKKTSTCGSMQTYWPGSSKG